MGRFLFRMDPSRGFIEGKPTNQISEGGNFKVRRRFRSEDTTKAVRTLRGKANGNNDITIVKGRKHTFVRFEVDRVTGSPSRSELAPRRMTPFGRSVTVNMSFRVRAQQMDRLTGYVLQFWQPIISPIAGVRVSGGRLEVVARSSGKVASKRLTRGWNDLSVTLRPGPNGLMRVTGDLNGQVLGRIDGGSQAGRAQSDIFRPKFGWYGSLDQRVRVDYRSLELLEGA
jgi:hypothetical protein